MLQHCLLGLEEEVVTISQDLLAVKVLPGLLG